MNKERLLLLADKLDTVPPDGFDLKEWTNDKLAEERGCGFVGCAIGWALTMPEFQSQGFVEEDAAPSYEESWGWDAVERFFGLIPAESEYLFEASRYKSGASPSAVASRIRAMFGEVLT